MIVRVPVSPLWRDQAHALGLAQPQLRDSIKSGHGAVAGYLGELVFLHLHGGRRADTYDYDVVLPDGQTVEVKTKLTGVEPLYHYDCSVADANTRQRCDWYGFVRVSVDHEVAWWLGAIGRDDFYRQARYVPKGQMDGSNGWVASASCWSVPASTLGDIPGYGSSLTPGFTLET